MRRDIKLPVADVSNALGRQQPVLCQEQFSLMAVALGLTQCQAVGEAMKCTRQSPYLVDTQRCCTRRRCQQSLVNGKLVHIAQ